MRVDVIRGVDHDCDRLILHLRTGDGRRGVVRHNNVERASCRVICGILGRPGDRCGTVVEGLTIQRGVAAHDSRCRTAE